MAYENAADRDAREAREQRAAAKAKPERAVARAADAQAAMTDDERNESVRTAAKAKAAEARGSAAL